MGEQGSRGKRKVNKQHLLSYMNLNARKPPTKSIKNNSAARSKCFSRTCRTGGPRIRSIVATRKNRVARPSRLIERNETNGISIAPEAIVATLNGIGVKTAAARNQLPQASANDRNRSQ